MGDVYIQNVHVAGINVKSFDGSLTKRFNIADVDRVSGRQIESGYTRLTEEEYNKLLAESKLFSHFIKLKKLVVHTELPPDAQTPHEALVGARKEVVKRDKRIESLQAQNTELQGKLKAAEKDYKALAAAGGSAEALEKKSVELQEALVVGADQAERIAFLLTRAEADRAAIEGKDEEIERLTRELNEAKAGQVENAKSEPESELESEPKAGSKKAEVDDSEGVSF